MTAFEKAWDIFKSVYRRVFTNEELQGIANDNHHLLQEPLDPDPSVDFPSQCKQCHAEINSLVEGIPNLCSRCIHPWVEERIMESMEISGLLGGGEADSEVNFKNFRDSMGGMA